MILSNDGINTKGKKKLRIVALRPAAIYGPGEERHLPRIIKTAEQGLFRFTIGDPKDMVEWVYVDNLVHAHLIAEKRLELDAPGVAGSGFFISDQAPINNWEFLGKFVSGLGFTPPSLNIPLWFMFYLGLIIESAHTLISPIYNFEPFLTRAEVYKVGVEHYFDSERAKNVLGYKPIVDSTEGLNRTIDYFKKEMKIKKNGKNFIIILLIGLVILLLILYLFIFK